MDDILAFVCPVAPKTEIPNEVLQNIALFYLSLATKIRTLKADASQQRRACMFVGACILPPVAILHNRRWIPSSRNDLPFLFERINDPRSQVCHVFLGPTTLCRKGWNPHQSRLETDVSHGSCRVLVWAQESQSASGDLAHSLEVLRALYEALCGVLVSLSDSHPSCDGLKSSSADDSMS
jgi:hypothetical protein